MIGATKKRIIELLESNYCGIDTLRYSKRYDSGDNRTKNIRWLISTFSCSYYIASTLVDRANNYSDWS